MSTVQKRVGELVGEIRSAFAGAFDISADFLLTEYNGLAQALTLLLPTYDAEMTVQAVDGEIETGLLPEQIRRVYAGDRELLRAPRTLVGLIRAPLYAIGEDRLYVQSTGTHRICYRSLPTPVTAQTAAQTAIPFPIHTLPLLRAYLFRRAYLYVGDHECAAVSGAEYERLFAEYRAQVGKMAWEAE